MFVYKYVDVFWGVKIRADFCARPRGGEKCQDARVLASVRRFDGRHIFGSCLCFFARGGLFMPNSDCGFLTRIIWGGR